MIQWLDKYWLLLYLGGDVLLFVVAVLLWKPGLKPYAGLLFVFGLIPPLAFIAVLLEPSPDS